MIGPAKTVPSPERRRRRHPPLPIILFLLAATAAVASLAPVAAALSTGAISSVRSGRAATPRLRRTPPRFAPPLAASPSSSSTTEEEDARAEAEILFARAKEIRDSLPPDAAVSADLSGATAASDVQSGGGSLLPPRPFVGYRLYVDVGRESGTWMDPRWGASGARIDFTVDVSFLTPHTDDGGDDRDGGMDVSLADEEVRGRMVKDNFGGDSGAVRIVETRTDAARLRGGFDRMACRGGGYRIDRGGGNGSGAVRFHLLVDGTPTEGPGSTYGDVSVPAGCLYFSLPCFGSDGISNLSRREGPATVRQVGWHTGWRRKESRIVGTFRAVPIEEARAKDRY